MTPWGSSWMMPTRSRRHRPTSRHARARWPWITGSAALALLLALQAINHWRDALAASPHWSAALGRTYAAIGVPLEPHWNLSDYEVRQQGAIADPADSQIIRVRLSLANHASRAQPLPLLRVTLLDRYGKRVASSELTPESVLARERAAARISRARRARRQ